MKINFFKSYFHSNIIYSAKHVQEAYSFMEARGKSKVLKSCYRQLEESYITKSKVKFSYQIQTYCTTEAFLDDVLHVV